MRTFTKKNGRFFEFFDFWGVIKHRLGRLQEYTRKIRRLVFESFYTSIYILIDHTLSKKLLLKPRRTRPERKLSRKAKQKQEKIGASAA
jgi:hypothetical protein